jgi:ABC-2 type transport system permease protein
MSVASGLAAPARKAEGAPRGAGLRAAGALARQVFRDARIRTFAFAYLFAIYSYIQPAGFRRAYPTLADRIAFAHSFAGNDAIRLFYGYPYDVVSIGGYSAWRVGGALAIVAAVFGVLAAVRAFRTEEDAGRMELVVAGAVGRQTIYLSALAAIAGGVLVLWLAESVGFIVGGLPVGGSAYLALSTAAVVALFVAMGALVSQLAPTRRVALELGVALVGVSWLMRVVADSSGSAGALRWATPLGWAEEMRPFAGTRPAVLLLFLATSALLLAAAGLISARRDVGRGLIAGRDSAQPRFGLLGSATAQALRGERASLIVWTTSVAVFGVVFGMISTSVSAAGISRSLREEFAKFGSGSIATPSGYLSFVFIVFILAVSLFACAQIGAARDEEAAQRLETLLSLPVSRVRWLGGRLLLAALGIAVLSVTAGVLAWAGAVSQGLSVSLPKLLEAGINCLPVALLFLGIAALAYAIVPRASAGIAYGLVTVSFLWYLVGALLDAPKWLAEVTPFAHVGLVPTQTFRAGPAGIMVAIGVLAAVAALGMFRRRDLLGA